MVESLDGWRPPAPPGPMILEGEQALLAPLSLADAPALFAANGADPGLWTWLPYGPFGSAEDYAAWVAWAAARPDPRFFAISARGAAGPAGVASLMRAAPEHGAVEIGHICFAPALQRSAAASEAIFLLADWAFGAGYRRLEWKCDAGNAPSRRAAARFGFAFEGVFRQHLIVKGANRDTAWFAIVDRDWPELRAAHLAWRDAADADGRQHRRLGDLTAPVRIRAEAEHRPPAAP